MTPWAGVPEPEFPPLTIAQKLRFARRVIAIAICVFGLFGPLLIFRALGAQVAAARVVRLACRGSLWSMGLSVHRSGAAPIRKGALVANHASWLDIFTLNSCAGVTFVSKAEVSAWPVIGLLARNTGTLFINRRRSQARDHGNVLASALAQGRLLLFFPEGTSTDGQRVLPFRSTLFAAFEGCEPVDIQPVSVTYHAPAGEIPAFYGWWGDMGFFDHFVRTIAQHPQGRVEIVFHDPVRFDDTIDRKAVARVCEDAVRSGLQVL